MATTTEELQEQSKGHRTQPSAPPDLGNMRLRDLESEEEPAIAGGVRVFPKLPVSEQRRARSDGAIPEEEEVQDEAQLSSPASAPNRPRQADAPGRHRGHVGASSFGSIALARPMNAHRPPDPGSDADVPLAKCPSCRDPFRTHAMARSEAAALAGVEEDSEEILVDASSLREPYLLLCGHSFCATCIKGVQRQPIDRMAAAAYVTDTSDVIPDSIIQCVLCGQPTPVGGADDALQRSVPLNVALVEYLDSKYMDLAGYHRRLDKGKGVPQEQDVGPGAANKLICEECQAVPPIVYCEQCKAPYCADCSESVHASRVMKRHKLVPVQAQPLEVPKCPEHKEELSLFCFTCQVPICALCKDFGGHTGHQTQSMAEAVDDVRALVSLHGQQLRQLTAELDDAALSMATAVMAVESVAEDAAATIEAQFAKILGLLNTRKNMLLYEVQRIKTEKVRTLHSQRAQLAAALSELRATTERSHRVLGTSGPILVSEKRPLLGIVERAFKRGTSFPPEPAVTPTIWPRFPANMLQAIESYGFVSGPNPPTIKQCRAGPTWLEVVWEMVVEQVVVRQNTGVGLSGGVGGAEDGKVVEEDFAETGGDEEVKGNGNGLGAIKRASSLALLPVSSYILEMGSLDDPEFRHGVRVVRPHGHGSSSTAGGPELDVENAAASAVAAAGGSLSSLLTPNAPLRSHLDDYSEYQAAEPVEAGGDGPAGGVEQKQGGITEVYQPDLQLYHSSMIRVYDGKEPASTVKNLQPGCRYNFRVRAKYIDGLGPWSSMRTFSTSAEESRFQMHFKFSGTTVLYSIPQAGVYRLSARGAKAADGEFRRGGRGAIITADFTLQREDKLHILCGGMSKRNPQGPDSGGGGGTFVAINDKSRPLLVAGGGGGTRGQQDFSYHGQDASLEEAGGAGVADNDHCRGSGGKEGASGNAPLDSSHGGAGGGFFGKGGKSWHGPMAMSFADGGAPGQNGGMGGGGSTGKFGGGGGGGYSGGGGGWGGGGGGSFVLPGAANVAKRVGNATDGSLSLLYLGPV